MRIEGKKPIAIVAVETATPELLDIVDPAGDARLLISGARAAVLALANERDAADPAQPVLVQRAPWLDVETALALADPGRDLERGPAGPLHPVPMDCTESAKAALSLARSGGVASGCLGPPDLRRRCERFGRGDQPGESGPGQRMVARAKLPLEGMPDTQIVAFRASDDGQEHVALIIGAPGGRPPLVRLHSECLTGDVFGSLKCDCGPQLKEALKIIGNPGAGYFFTCVRKGGALA